MTLRIYDFVIETLRLLAPSIDAIARRDADLARQMRRASASVALNTAEAAGNDGGHRRERFRTALGSAKETRACLEVADALGYMVIDDRLVDRLDRIAATLYRLGH
jgi:four helix bundle protein